MDAPTNAADNAADDGNFLDPTDPAWLHVDACRPSRFPPRESPVSYREGRFWQPDVTVATVVVRDGRLLCVEERVAGRLVINQPAGHLEPNESLLEAALRETREETGWDVCLTGFIGAYQWQAPVNPDGTGGRHYLRFAFCADPVRFDSGRSLDEGIVRSVWWTPTELQAESPRHRSPLVWQVVADFLAGRRQPLELVRMIA